MREIKFRAWDEKSKTMYHSESWHFNSEYQMLSFSFDIKDKEELYPEEDKKEFAENIAQAESLKDRKKVLILLRQLQDKLK